MGRVGGRRVRDRVRRGCRLRRPRGRRSQRRRGRGGGRRRDGVRRGPARRRRGQGCARCTAARRQPAGAHGSRRPRSCRDRALVRRARRPPRSARSRRPRYPRCVNAGLTSGRGIVVASWLRYFLFAVTAIPVALGVDALDDPAVLIALLLFFASLVVWCWALGLAAVRTTRGDDVQVWSLFLLEGRVPAGVRWHLYGSFVVCLAVTIATASAKPFGVLVPMYPLCRVGLWGARHCGSA